MRQRWCARRRRQTPTPPAGGRSNADRHRRRTDAARENGTARRRHAMNRGACRIRQGGAFQPSQPTRARTAPDSLTSGRGLYWARRPRKPPYALGCNASWTLVIAQPIVPPHVPSVLFKAVHLPRFELDNHYVNLFFLLIKNNC